MFGVVFPEVSLPMDPSAFAQLTPTHWLLDLSALAPSHTALREVCVFLLPAAAAALPPTKSLAVYAAPPASESFTFLGALSHSRPSALLRLPWDDDAAAAADAVALAPAGAATGARLGVAVEDTASLQPVADAEGGKRVERVALRVGENLFNYMQSFCGADGGRLVVPTDILDRWFRKFQERASKDPSYLKGFSL